ncbi:endonuclease/exonuclease/phosphatase family protein [Aerosakkonemataceae cyanobacterium BLCC-F154]|uniref:Endonuclease/exonuclease/phosphatase family protein n=1 Tax=Floridaenema fluviatile BLCC-F154 TaxID=3153640 RepID=A0ABV4Y9U0_9CYAN
MIGKSKFKDLISGSFILVTILITLLTITGHLGKFNYILDMTAHFKVQYLIVGFCPFFFFLLTRNKLWWIISLSCIFLNLMEVVPWYLPPAAIAQETKSGQLRVLISNVLFKNKNYAAVISLVRKENPDVAVFVEVGKVWNQELTVLKDLLPYHVVSQDSPRFGITLYSKLPLENVSIEEFQGSRKTIVAAIKFQGKEITVIGTHPSYPIRKSGFLQRNLQLEAMADYLKKNKNPVILMGDFNITMWSPIYQRFIQETQLENARFGFGVQPTWPSSLPLLAIPIDHCLVSGNIQVIKSRIGRDVGSDHLPIITDLAIGD